MLKLYALPTFAYLAVLIVLVSLGTWQVQRLGWKNDLIGRVAARVDEAPGALPMAAQWRRPAFADDNEYRPFRLTGRFHSADTDRPDFRRFYTFTLLAEPQGPLGGQGYWAMHLFELEDGGVVYVNRGFVPLAARGHEQAPPVGEVTLTGLLRQSSGGNAFTPPCEPAAFTCYTNDLSRAAGLAGLENVAPFYIDMAAAFTPASGVPQAGETRVNFPNNHLQYVVTWYGLAAALTGVFAAFMVGRLRAGRPRT